MLIIRVIVCFFVIFLAACSPNNSELFESSIWANEFTDIKNIQQYSDSSLFLISSHNELSTKLIEVSTKDGSVINERAISYWLKSSKNIVAYYEDKEKHINISTFDAMDGEPAWTINKKASVIGLLDDRSMLLRGDDSFVYYAKLEADKWNIKWSYQLNKIFAQVSNFVQVGDQVVLNILQSQHPENYEKLRSNCFKLKENKEMGNCYKSINRAEYDEKVRHLIAFDMESGKVKAKTLLLDQNKLVYQKLFALDNNSFLKQTYGNLTLYNKNLQVIWTHNTIELNDSRYNNYISDLQIINENQALIYSAGNYIYHLTLAKGVVTWSKEISGRVNDIELYDEGVILIGTDKFTDYYGKIRDIPEVVAVNIDTQETIKNLEFGESVLQILASGEHVYIRTESMIRAIM